MSYISSIEFNKLPVFINNTDALVYLPPGELYRSAYDPIKDIATVNITTDKVVKLGFTSAGNTTHTFRITTYMISGIPGLTPYSAVINWGDGTVQKLYSYQTMNRYEIVFTHTYLNAGDYEVNLEVSNPEFIKQIDAPNSSLKSFEDLNKFTDLTAFFAQGNLIEGINISNETLVYVQLNGNKLPSSSINSLLSTFNTLNKGNDFTMLLKSQTTGAGPTGQGITDKADLITRGASVQTD